MTSAVRAAVGGAEIQRTITPVDGSVYAERPLATSEEVAGALERARKAQAGWRRRAVEERAALMSAFVDAFVARADEIAAEITWQMGRPIRYTPGEVRGFEERARHMIAAAPQALADLAALSAARRSASCSSSRPGTIPTSPPSTPSCRR